MMKFTIASDNTNYMEYSTEENLKPLDLAYKYGRAESGETIRIYTDGDMDKWPDYTVWWDSIYRKYCVRKGIPMEMD